MISINEIKIGDYVIVEYEGTRRNGEVNNVNRDDKQVCVETDVQEFWYEPEDLYPIPINDEEMLAEINDKIGNCYVWQGLPQREDRRDHPNVHYIHQLQNHYLQMTKVHLTDEVIA